MGERKVSKSGRVHRCCVCGREGAWGPGWGWYDLPGLGRYKTCSDPCDDKLTDRWALRDITTYAPSSQGDTEKP